jgi:hypothetical protein
MSTISGPEIRDHVVGWAAHSGASVGETFIDGFVKRGPLILVEVVFFVHDDELEDGAFRKVARDVEHETTSSNLGLDRPRAPRGLSRQRARQRVVRGAVAFESRLPTEPRLKRSVDPMAVA